MSKLFIVTLLTYTLCGCATKRNIALNPASTPIHRGQKITYSMHEPTIFIACTPKVAANLTLSSAASDPITIYDNSVITNNLVEDPARSIAATIVQDLAKEYGLIYVPPSEISTGDNEEDLVAASKNCDLVVDVKTFYWGYGYLPFNWKDYRLIFGVNLQLLDTKQKRFIATGHSIYDSHKIDDMTLSINKLLGNQAQGLKFLLKKAEEHCLSEFRENIY